MAKQRCVNTFQPKKFHPSYSRTDVFNPKKTLIFMDFPCLRKNKFLAIIYGSICLLILFQVPHAYETRFHVRCTTQTRNEWHHPRTWRRCACQGLQPTLGVLGSRYDRRRAASAELPSVKNVVGRWWMENRSKTFNRSPTSRKKTCEPIWRKATRHRG